MKQPLTYILIAVSLMSGATAMAQADISMVTHWNNRANYNPAFIARTDYLYLFSNTRHQWLGVNGAPVVFNVQVSQYFHSFRSALGLSFVNDKIGVTQALNPMFTYAFRIAKKEGWALSMGLSGGMFVRSINGSLFEAETANDPSLFHDYKKIYNPDFNAGLEFQNNRFICGISSTHIFSIGKADSLFLNTNHRYGYLIYKNDNLRLISYGLGMQVVNRYDLTVLEGNFSFRFKQHPTGLLKGPREILDFGFTYRTSHETTLMFGVMISRYLRIGYAYDQNLLPVYYRNKTHEVMLEYRIPAKAAAPEFHCGPKEYWYL